MKKIFNNPEIQIIKLNVNDVIATSVQFGNTIKDGSQARTTGRQTWRDLINEDEE